MGGRMLAVASRVQQTRAAQRISTMLGGARKVRILPPPSRRVPEMLHHAKPALLPCAKPTDTH
eukprot:4461161-Prymnesium_polylepis.1